MVNLVVVVLFLKQHLTWDFADLWEEPQGLMPVLSVKPGNSNAEGSVRVRNKGCIKVEL